MTQEDEIDEVIKFMEVKPKKPGIYLVTVYMLAGAYERTEAVFNGEDWELGEYEGVGYVCFIKEKLED